MPADGSVELPIVRCISAQSAVILGSRKLMRSYFVSVGRLWHSRVGSLSLALLLATCASSAFSQANGSIALTVTNANGSANNGQVALGGSISLSTVLKN